MKPAGLKRGKALELEEELSRAIEAGQYRPDAAIPSVRELAKAHGVHYNTVQTVVKRLAARGLVTSIKRRGVFVSPRITSSVRPDEFPRDMARSPHFPLHLLGPLGIMCVEALAGDPINSDFPLVRSLEAIAAESGFPVFRYDLNSRTLANPAALVEHCISDHVGGVIIVGVRDTEPLGPVLVQLRERNVPVAVCPLGRQSIAASLHVPIVNADDQVAGVVAAQHLYDLGHRKLAMITYDRPRPYIDQRIAGFKAVCQLHRLDCEPEQIIRLPVSEMTGPAHRQVGFEAFSMLPAGITGIFCINDSTAAGVIDAAVAAGHVISKTLSVVGHDNDLRYDDKQITTVVPPLAQIARRACEFLQTPSIAAAELAEHVILRPQLLWRRSSGRCLAAPERARMAAKPLTPV